MEKTYTFIATIIVAIVIGFIGWQWINTKKSELEKNTIIRCGEIGAKTGNTDNPFNGAVYQICMEDNGYKTVVK